MEVPFPSLLPATSDLKNSQLHAQHGLGTDGYHHDHRHEEYSPHPSNISSTENKNSDDQPFRSRSNSGRGKNALGLTLGLGLGSLSEDLGLGSLMGMGLGGRSTKIRLTDYIRLVNEQKHSRQLAIFIFLNVIFMVTQFFYGFLISNFGLISNACHTGFDIFALSTSLYAMLISRKPAKFPFSYGFGRIEVLGGFTNSVFLIFVAIFVIFDCFHTLFKNEITNADIAAVRMSSFGLMIDVCGIVMFRRYAKLKFFSHQYTGVYINESGGGHESNIFGVFLHILSDALTHLGFLFASFLFNWRHMKYAYAIVPLCVSILILRLVYPLFYHSSLILLQTTPHHIRMHLEKCIRDISYYDGVLECRNIHWWSNAGGIVVGSLHVRVRSDANEQQILGYCNSSLKKYVQHLTIQIEKDQPVAWMMGMVPTSGTGGGASGNIHSMGGDVNALGVGQ